MKNTNVYKTIDEARPAFRWWSDGTEVYTIDGKFYALSGWNGEMYTSCWECEDEFTSIDSGEYCIRPLYKYRVCEIDIGSLDDSSDEYEDAIKIVGYEIV